MSDRMDTQQRLIDATKLIMVTHGVEGCTLERITQAAHFTRGAFYSNFQSKEELFIAVAEEEYEDGIDRINAFIEHLHSTLNTQAHTRELTIEDLQRILSDILVSFLSHMKLGRNFYILHNEFLIRSARVPEWARQFSEINREFVLALGQAVTYIMDSLGRKLLWSPEAVAQAVIGIVLRANGIASWNHDPDSGSPAQRQHARQQVVEQTLVAQEVTALVVPLLIACSQPASRQ